MGLLGRAAAEGRPFILRDVPEGYLGVGSALGQGNPRNLVISPRNVDGAADAVIELGFLGPVNPAFVSLLEQMSDPPRLAFRSARYRIELQNFLEETQRQAEELQAQGEELRSRTRSSKSKAGR